MSSLFFLKYFTCLMVMATLIETKNAFVYNQNKQQIQILYKEPTLISLQAHPDADRPIKPIKINDIKSIEQFLTNRIVLREKQIYELGKTWFQNGNQALVEQAEYYYYNQKYNLDQKREEIPICIISTFVNFFDSTVWKRYLDNFEAQNYSNFQIYMTNDLPTDHSTSQIKFLIESQYPRLSKRVKIIQNSDKIGMLGNHDIAIRNYCKDNAIIAEVDGDDTLAGKQVLNLVNAFYQEVPDTWVVCSNFMTLAKGRFKAYAINKIPDQVFKENTYRTQGKWATSHLKTYLKRAYMKIDPSFFWRSPGKYLLRATDHYTMYPLIQIAGKKHTRLLKQFLYVYIQNLQEKDQCQNLVTRASGSFSKIQTPFQHLQNLDQEAKLVENYEVPLQVIIQYNKRVNEGKQCIKQWRQELEEPQFLQQISLTKVVLQREKVHSKLDRQKMRQPEESTKKVEAKQLDPEVQLKRKTKENRSSEKKEQTNIILEDINLLRISVDLIACVVIFVIACIENDSSHKKREAASESQVPKSEYMILDTENIII